MQKNININTTLGDFVAKYPKTRKVFEKFGFDYCCGGKKNIKLAAKEKKFEMKKLILELETAINESNEKKTEKIWINEPLSDIVTHILSTHHAYLHKELPYIDKLMDKIVLVHGPKHGDTLNKLNASYKLFKEKLEQHLSDEEILLFPYIQKLEKATKVKNPAIETKKFLKLVNNLGAEHDEAGDLLLEMRNLTSDYTLPSDACKSFEELYERLQAIEDDLHVHIHLENTILFPRLVVLINS